MTYFVLKVPLNPNQPTCLDILTFENSLQECIVFLYDSGFSIETLCTE